MHRRYEWPDIESRSLTSRAGTTHAITRVDDSVLVVFCVRCRVFRKFAHNSPPLLAMNDYNRGFIVNVLEIQDVHHLAGN